MSIRDFPRSQTIGFVWTIIYTVLAAMGPTAFRNSDLESVLVVFVLPVACLLAVFAYFRNGGYIAFGTLALSTLTLSIPFEPVHRMPDLATLYSMLTLLVGAPLALAWSFWLTYRARHSASTI
jgi:hypothetical protein